MDEETKRLDLDRLKAEAQCRREALVMAGCSTYIVSRNHLPPSIICLCCGMRSFNSNDIAFRYCVVCHAYHHEWVRKL